uniref:ABC1 atypical kinase-like domain-containing protein n=1 Tax=Kalanchoe fedtschenkoi TaxID=63787 RepID=A0A7N0SX17_KALFE
MVGMLSSHCCFSRNVDLAKAANELSSVGSISTAKRKRKSCVSSPGRKGFRLRVELRQTDSRAKLGPNGSAIQMVPTSEIVKRKTAVKKVEIINGKEKVVNGVAIVKVVKTPVESGKGENIKQLPPAEESQPIISVKTYSWSDENYSSLHRNIEVWSLVISMRIRFLLDNAKWTYLGGFTEDRKKKRMRRTASWLREQMLQLGATFIKLGQLLSSRSDLLPTEYVEELAKLQDKVPAFPSKRARELIESELRAPVEALFQKFEDQPIAAASLGQVHRAVLHNGEKVVVKVQRPGLKRLFDIDMKNMKILAEYFQRTGTLGGPIKDWVGVYEECSMILYQEIDYINEGKNCDRFRRDFRNIKWVRVPLIFWDYTGSKVITMEYVPGIKINQLHVLDARRVDRSRIASHVVESYLIQVLRTGFFHADPHPGNLAIDTDEALIYYDFGMMGDIKSSTRERLLELFYAIYEKDIKKVMKSLVDLGALKSAGDMSSVRRSVQFFLDNLLNQKPDHETTFSAIGEDLFAIATDQPFQFPSTFAFVLRAFTTLEGIGNILDPNFSFMKIAAPFAEEILMKRHQQSGALLVAELGKQADDARNHTMSMPYRIQRIEEFIKQLDSGDLKLRVRVLESERAAQKASLLQVATIHTVLGCTLLNIGLTLYSRGIGVLSNVSFFAAGLFLLLVLRSVQKAKDIEKFEKMI